MTTTTGSNRRLVNLWADEDDVQRLEQLARDADRSRSAELRIALREYLERAAEPSHQKEATT